MYTSLVCLALSAASVPGAAIPVAPSWRSDYTLALKEGQSSKRPLAIFVASGPEGWDKVSKDGGLDKEAKELLTTRYVCVYIDTSGEHGRRLADEFEITNGHGLVIGDSTGAKQAFWHAGKLSNDDLDRYLRKYADPDRVIAKTETLADARPAAAPVSRSISTSGYYAPPAYYQPSMRSFGGFGGCSS
jgi:hypothetical protein